jgi:hypothetical protein
MWLMCRQGIQQNVLVARHNEMVDVLWKQRTLSDFVDPVKRFPIEIIERIFGFVAYHVRGLELEGPWWARASPSSEITARSRDAPLILASVSRAWCEIATTYPPLWSTIIIDQSEEDYLERMDLFLDRSGKELLDVVLLYYGPRALHLEDFLMGHADRLNSFVPLSVKYDRGPYTGTLETLARSMNWNIYRSSRRRISTVPIPKCVRRVQLPEVYFDHEALNQFMCFQNLESLSVSIKLEPKSTLWDREVRFELLQHLRLDISYKPQSKPMRFTSEPLLVEWLECPALLDLDLSYFIHQEASRELYVRLEAGLLRFRSLRNLQVHLDVPAMTSRDFDPGEIMRPSTSDGGLELVQLAFKRVRIRETLWKGACTERFFSVFIPNRHLVWHYGQFPSPIIFNTLKTMHIIYHMEGDQSALIARDISQLEFPHLEELYLEKKAPRLLDLLYAPRLESLHIDGFIPSDLRHISNSTISTVRLQFREFHPDPWVTYLPSADELHIDVQLSDLFCLNVHPSLIHSVTMNIYWENLSLPPNWTADHVQAVLGTVTDLSVDNMEYDIGLNYGSSYHAQAIPPFLMPFVFLKCLNLLVRQEIGQATSIDQLAQHLLDPNFLPELEVLSFSEYPSWPDFFQSIQQRQTGFLSGQFRTALKEVTIRGPVHGFLLEHLRESLAGKYIGRFNLPPRSKGSKEWPVPPFTFEEVDTDGLLCCYICYKAGLELGCMVPLKASAKDMQSCDRAEGEFGQELSRVFTP